MQVIYSALLAGFGISRSNCLEISNTKLKLTDKIILLFVF